MIFLVNPGEKRPTDAKFFGTWANARKLTEAAKRPGSHASKLLAAARRKRKRRNPKSRRAKTATSVARSEVSMARRSHRRKSAPRRSVRRASARRLRRNPAPRRARRHRSRGLARRVMHRNPRHVRRHRSYRRNPASGLVNGLLTALMDGLKVTGGVLGQNFITRNIPDVFPATMSMSAQLNGALKDVVTIVAGSYGLHKVMSADSARFVVAGQAHAAIARQIRAANIATLSTALGEYDPIRLGTYTGRFPASGAPTSRAALLPSNVQTLKNIGIYTDGVPSFSPSIY